MGHTLEFVVNEELRQHEQEPKRIHTIHQRVDQPRVPAVEEEKETKYVLNVK